MTARAWNPKIRFTCSDYREEREVVVMSALWNVQLKWSYCISVCATFWMWRGRLTTSSRGCLTTWMFGCMMTRRLTCWSIGTTHSSTSIKLSKFWFFKFIIYLFILFSNVDVLRHLFIIFYLDQSQLSGMLLNSCLSFFRYQSTLYQTTLFYGFLFLHSMFARKLIFALY